MGATPAMRDQLYRAYMEFFETAERKRRWNLWDDIPWERLDGSKNSALKNKVVEAFCGVELYVPDYVVHGFQWTRDRMGLAWFWANWGYEESKHALAFREYLTRSGALDADEYDRFERAVFGRHWTLPYESWRQANVYAALQEMFTHLIYKEHRALAAREGDAVLEQICYFTSRDEAAHAAFYRKCICFELEEDREGTIADIALVLGDFMMPGFGLVPGYEVTQQHIVEMVGIDRSYFLQHGVLTLLKSLGLSRKEFSRALRQNRRPPPELDAPVAVATS